MEENQKITRPSKKIDQIEVESLMENTKVSFPWGMFILCLIVDVVDIFGYFGVISGIIWWILTMFIVTPLLIWYINSREKKFSADNIKTSLQIRGDIRQAREASKLTRESKNLTKAGKIAEASEKAASAVKKASKLPNWLKYASVISENIPFVEWLPANTIILYLAYKDNLSSVKQMKDNMNETLNSIEFKTTNRS